MKKILHVSAHMGGGVGNAISSLVVHEKAHSQDSHKILILDEPESHQYIGVCEDAGVLVLRGSQVIIQDEFLWADVLIIHWWHHPVMASFLSKFPQVDVRMVIWTHVNGCNYPCIPFEFTQIPHKIFFTTPFSFENSLWDDSQRLLVQKKSAVVYGLGKINSHNEFTKPTSSEKFIIGYIGTLSPNKIHPNFIDICYEVLKEVPNAIFIMVGDVSNAEKLLRRAGELGIYERFEFTGYEEQILEKLKLFDIFAYPLNPKHFGTTENALLEAMAFGLPVIAMNHNSEKYIIKHHKKIGLLADSVEHYVECVKFLHDNPNEMRMIGKNAQNYIRETFTFERNVMDFRAQLMQVLRHPKKHISFRDVCGESPYEWFLNFLGDDKKYFEGSVDINKLSQKSFFEGKIKSSSPILREKNKSSIRHFSEHFPNDPYLSYWSELLCS